MTSLKPERLHRRGVPRELATGLSVDRAALREEARSGARTPVSQLPKQWTPCFLAHKMLSSFPSTA